MNNKLNIIMEIEKMEIIFWMLIGIISVVAVWAVHQDLTKTEGERRNYKGSHGGHNYGGF